MLKPVSYFPVCKRLFTGLCMVLLCFSVTAQNQKQTKPDNFTRYSLAGKTAVYDEHRLYYVAAFLSANQKPANAIRFIDEQHAIVEISSRSVFDSLKVSAKLAPANNQWKLTTATEKLLQNSRPGQLYNFIVSVRNAERFEDSLSHNQALMKLIAKNSASNSFVIYCSTTTINQLVVADNNAIFIDVKAEPHAEINIIGYDRSFNGINAVDYLLPGANGEGIVAGVKEQNIDAADIDLIGRVLPSPIASATNTYHATVIASIIGGAGNSFYNGRGIANHCNFFPSSFDDLFADDNSILIANKVSVQNHSYGTVIQQFYGAEAVSYDALAWNNKTIVPVFSAGNQGSGFATEGPYANMPGFANITGNFKMAKNILTIGAVDGRNNVASESSSGPLYDGRLAPQLIALGPNGTSDAAAVVSGTIAVLQQVYADSNAQTLPAASLVKAVLFNNAEDIYLKGIDYKTGYGLVDAYQSVLAIQQKKYEAGTIKQGETWTKTIAIPANVANLKVTLAWTDSAASLNNNRALINDLDLEIKQLSGGDIYQPWVLNSSPVIDSIILIPVRKRDSLNTAEQVIIDFPDAGNYEIRVAGYSISNGSIPFHIAYNADTIHTFYFTNPISTSDVYPDKNETLTIKWKCIVADNNETGNLFISYDRGLNWELLRSGKILSESEFDWPIKDTASTAVLKMQTAFGDFFSNEFIISSIIRPVIDYNCTDSLRISWPAHIYANAYKIFALADSPYLKQIQTVSETFVVLKKATNPYTYYAVQAALSNNIEAQRSFAFNINLQGVGCFYKSLYYNLLPQNELDIILELSETTLSDSVFFEKVDGNNNLLETFGSAAVTANNFNYIQHVNTQPPGNMYVRVRIKLKNGTTIYTQTISIITAGNKYIFFYPNPVSKNGVLNYILSEALPGDNRLQLFDVSGRLVRNFESLPLTISVYGLANGLYIYKLFSTDNKTLETGRLLIQ